MPELPTWPEDHPRSSIWHVRVDGIAVPVIHCDRGDVALWVSESPCTVEITALGGIPQAFAQAQLRPRRLGIIPEISPERIAFDLPGPARALCEVPGTPLLHVFAERAPAVAPAGARVIPAGTRVSEQLLTLTEGSCLWLERGAVLHAHVLAQGAGITIGGGGMITGKGLQGRNRHLTADSCPGLRISDVTVVDPGGWSVVLGACDDALLEDLRVLSPGSGSGTDGIDLVGCRRTRVRRSYIISGDDAVVIKAFPASSTSGIWARSVQDIQVEDCVLGTHGGHCMEIGHELTVPEVRNIRFQDIDVLFAHGFGAPFGIHVGDRATVSQVTWERVVIEHCYHQLLDLRVMRSRFSRDRERGHIRDLRFTDIDWWTTPYNAGYTLATIAGFDVNHRVSGVVCTRFRRDGVAAASADDLDLVMRHVDGLEFSA